MRPRRELTLAVLLCAVGAGAVVLAVGRVWLSTTLAAPGLPVEVERSTGAALEPAVRALGLLGLAGLAGLKRRDDTRR